MVGMMPCFVADWKAKFGEGHTTKFKGNRAVKILLAGRRRRHPLAGGVADRV
jgi:hypothetical protein